MCCSYNIVSCECLQMLGAPPSLKVGVPVNWVSGDIESIKYLTISSNRAEKF